MLPHRMEWLSSSILHCRLAGSHCRWWKKGHPSSFWIHQTFFWRFASSNHCFEELTDMRAADSQKSFMATARSYEIWILSIDWLSQSGLLSPLSLVRIHLHTSGPHQQRCITSTFQNAFSFGMQVEHLHPCASSVLRMDQKLVSFDTLLIQDFFFKQIFADCLPFGKLTKRAIIQHLLDPFFHMGWQHGSKTNIQSVEARMQQLQRQSTLSHIYEFNTWFAEGIPASHSQCIYLIMKHVYIYISAF